MAYVKKNWKNRQSENPNRRRLTTTGEANVYDVAREEGLVLEEGDAFSDQTMNDLEERIAAGFEETAPAIHVTDSSVHVTAADKTNWNSKAAGNHSHNLLTYTATHSKSGTVHTLAGLPTAAGIYIAQFKAVANFDAGNTFAGGYTAKPMGEETALPDKAFITGDLVSVVVDVSGKKLGFRLGGAGAPKFPTYTGAHALFGTEKKGYIELYSSGTITLYPARNYDFCLVGGGGGGGTGRTTSSGGAAGGGGGGGRITYSYGFTVSAQSSYAATIASGGGISSVGGTTSISNLSLFAAGGNGGETIFSSSNYGGAGGAGGSGGGSGGGPSTSTPGVGGSDGSQGGGANGGAGSGVTTRAFADPSFKLLSGGGGGGGYNAYGGVGGAGGGGQGGYRSEYAASPGSPNTGGGGGGGPGGNYAVGNEYGASGGSGIIIIRWGY